MRAPSCHQPGRITRVFGQSSHSVVPLAAVVRQARIHGYESKIFIKVSVRVHRPLRYVCEDTASYTSCSGDTPSIAAPLIHTIAGIEVLMAHLRVPEDRVCNQHCHCFASYHGCNSGGELGNWSCTPSWIWAATGNQAGIRPKHWHQRLRWRNAHHARRR